jgi:type IV pilus assembly protein PilA
MGQDSRQKQNLPAGLKGAKRMRNKQKGFSLIELLIVVAIILIIAAIAIPNLLRSKMAANEASAVGSLRTINTSCVAYSTTYNIGYPANLIDLGPSSTPSSTAADQVDSVLASGTKSGYVFTYAAGTPDAAGNINQYSISAVPVSPGVTGQRTFYTDQSGVIRADANGTASAISTPIS